MSSWRDPYGNEDEGAVGQRPTLTRVAGPDYGALSRLRRLSCDSDASPRDRVLPQPYGSSRPLAATAASDAVDAMVAASRRYDVAIDRSSPTALAAAPLAAAQAAAAAPSKHAYFPDAAGFELPPAAGTVSGLAAMPTAAADKAAAAVASVGSVAATAVRGGRSRPPPPLPHMASAAALQGSVRLQVPPHNPLVASQIAAQRAASTGASAPGAAAYGSSSHHGVTTPGAAYGPSSHQSRPEPDPETLLLLQQQQQQMQVLQNQVAALQSALVALTTSNALSMAPPAAAESPQSCALAPPLGPAGTALRYGADARCHEAPHAVPPPPTMAAVAAGPSGPLLSGCGGGKDAAAAVAPMTAAAAAVNKTCDAGTNTTFDVWHPTAEAAAAASAADAAPSDISKPCEETGDRRSVGVCTLRIAPASAGPGGAPKAAGGRLTSSIVSGSPPTAAAAGTAGAAAGGNERPLLSPERELPTVTMRLSQSDMIELASQLRQSQELSVTKSAETFAGPMLNVVCDQSAAPPLVDAARVPVVASNNGQSKATTEEALRSPADGVREARLSQGSKAPAGLRRLRASRRRRRRASNTGKSVSSGAALGATPLVGGVSSAVAPAKAASAYGRG